MLVLVAPVVVMPSAPWSFNEKNELAPLKIERLEPAGLAASIVLAGLPVLLTVVGAEAAGAVPTPIRVSKSEPVDPYDRPDIATTSDAALRALVAANAKLAASGVAPSANPARDPSGYLWNLGISASAASWTAN